MAAPHSSLKWLLRLCCASILLGVLGCAASSPGATILDSTTTFSQNVLVELPAPAAYRVGMLTEVTGAGAPIGDLSIRAARLAIEEINAAGGVDGIPMELVVRDVQSDPAVALQEYRKAILDDDLVALLGPLKSAYATRIIPEHQATHLPMFIGATNATLTQQGLPNLFRMRPSDSVTAAAMVTLAVEEFAAHRIGVIYDNDPFGSGGAQLIRRELHRRDRAPTHVISYTTGTQVFAQPVQKLAAANVDAVLIYGTNQTDVGHLLRSIRYWDVDVPILTSPGGASIVTHNVAADAQDGIFVVSDGILTATPRGVRFRQTFIERFGMQPDTYVAWYYDTIHLLAAILDRHPEATGAHLSDLIRQTTYRGTVGTYRFDDAGEGLHAVALVQMEAGVARYIGTYSTAGFVAAPAWVPPGGVVESVEQTP